jgi:hypothetical protein
VRLVAVQQGKANKPSRQCEGSAHGSCGDVRLLKSGAWNDHMFTTAQQSCYVCGTSRRLDF